MNPLNIVKIILQILQDEGYEESEISENKNEVAEEICELLKCY